MVYNSLKILCINLFLSLILSSSEIIVSVRETPSISSIIKMISLACLVSCALTLQKILNLSPTYLYYLQKQLLKDHFTKGHGSFLVEGHILILFFLNLALMVCPHITFTISKDMLLQILLIKIELVLAFIME